MAFNIIFQIDNFSKWDTMRSHLAIDASLLLGIGLLSASFVYAQSGTRGTSQGTGTRPAQTGSGTPTQGSGVHTGQPVVSFESKFWDFMQRSSYQHWGNLPGAPLNAFAGNEPHGAQVKVFANRTALSNPQTLPDKSVLIKENYDITGTQLMAITVIYRAEGLAPEAGNWYWMKFEPNGTISNMNRMPVGGKVSMCIECHRSADSGDYVFANDVR